MGSPGEGSEEREQEPLGWGKAIRSAQRPGGGGARFHHSYSPPLFMEHTLCGFSSWKKKTSLKTRMSIE